MSGSEEGTVDTDFLVSIPPNFFSVHTPDSGEKIDSDESYESLYVLNDVPSAKLRSSFNLSQSLYSSVNASAEAYKTGEQYSPITRSLFSVPASPRATIKSYFDTSYVTGKSKFCDDEEHCAASVKDGSGDRSSTIGPNQFMNYSFHNLEDQMNVKATEKNDKEKELIQAVDEYLDKVEKHDKKDVPSTIVNETPEENNHILNRFLRDDMERVKSIAVDGKSETDSFKFDIQQVDNLLNKMESTQSEIEKKLKSHDKNGTCTKKLTWVPGDYTVPIPNVGFGIREMCKSPETHASKSDKQKNPINEELCLRKTCTPFRGGITNVSHNIDTKQDSTPEEQSTGISTYRRLNLGERLYEHGVGYDNKQVPVSSCSGFEIKNLGKKQLFPNAFRKTSTFSFINREQLSPKLQTKQDSSTKEPADKVQEFHGQNKTDGGKRLLGVNADLCGLQKPGNNPKEMLNPGGLLSLSDLWIKDKVTYTEEPIKYKQKYEEEHYRRLHCEQMIHKMQYQILEQQEKLAVAIQVDQEKDKTIQQIRESWQQLTKHWSELENQRHKLEEELEKEKCSSKKNELEISKKVERWNVEIAQALDLAAGYKKKSEMMSLERETLKKEMDKRIKEMQEKLVSLDAENKQYITEKRKLIEELEEARHEAAEEKRLIHDTHKELQKSQECVSELKAELAAMQVEKQKLVTKYTEEQTHSRTLEQQIATMQQAMTDARHNEKQAVDKAKTYDQRLDAVRSELRVFYQRQLETVVKEKLKEFQDQLDSSELALKVELQTKEKQFSEKAINQCRIYAERHKKEITKMDEQFKKEMDTMRTKLADCEEKRTVAENRLKDETQRRKEITEKLQTVMEKQWKETLKIISNVSTGENVKNDPPNKKIPEHTKKRSDTSVDVTSVTSQESSSSSSVTFIEDDILPIRKESAKRIKNEDMPNHINLRDLNSPRRSSRCSTCNSEDILFGRDGLTTCRPAYEQGTMKPADQEQLKHYIQMLLKRSPGNPLENNSGNKAYHEICANDGARTTGLENLKWEELMRIGATPVTKHSEN